MEEEGEDTRVADVRAPGGVRIPPEMRGGAGAENKRESSKTDSPAAGLITRVPRARGNARTTPLMKPNDLTEAAV